jgi:hypothetical protein
MSLQALAERLRGLAAAASVSPPSSSSSSSSAAAHQQPPLPPSWMNQLRHAPRMFGLAVMRNSMSASLALLSGVLVLDTVLGEPRRRRAQNDAPPPTPPQQPSPSSAA